MSRGWVVRLMALAAGSFLLANTGSAYYYFTYFNSSASPYTPIVARFDLNTLSNNTVPFFVSSAGPSAFAPGDSFPAMVSEITAAANVWNGVSTSSIRLAYGGFFNPGTTESAPGVQIEFSDDIPPGLLAYTVPSVVGNLANGSSGPFLPLYLSLIELPSDYSKVAYFNGPSYSEEFFITLVHEFGHSMGLQHTLASSVMSTIDTSASTKASPLGADDVAGISLLYPSANYLSSVGSISGIVTMNGTGVNLASVVAISSSSQAVATLTNPDGTYQINGIAPGLYYVYVHPLPPPVEGEGSPDNIFLPKNSDGTYLVPDTGFATQFYPGTLDYLDAAVIPVTAGAVYPQPLNFNVIPVSSPGIATVRTFSYVQSTYISGAPILQGMKTTIAAGGSNSSGLLQPDNSLMPGLSVGAMGSVAQVTNLRPYPAGNPFIAVDVTPSFTAGPGPMHLLFSTPGNLYVRPSGFAVVQAPAPVISEVKATVSNGQPAVAIAGGQFSASTQILFDGVPATIQVQTGNLLIVIPPPAPAGYTAAVVAFNSDGQSSLFLSPTAATYTYVAPSASATPTGPSVVVSPSVIPAGAAVTVDVQGSDTHFSQALTTVGFGTSDVLVNQINVISSTHLTVTVTPNVTISAANITVTTGLEVISQAVGSQITTTSSQQQ
ncbi:MAG: matrixin family metalloprotease [Bryobacteraceae bacterium]